MFPYRVLGHLWIGPRFLNTPVGVGKVHINTRGAISNGNRAEWSSVPAVIIPVIKKIGRTRSGSPIC